ncbi:MAG: hypothetical protein P9M14_15110 [Candidatus Alcyoniella australis]|nr:hypothetical protein [Candidatus Alcyoniella australis]
MADQRGHKLLWTLLAIAVVILLVTWIVRLGNSEPPQVWHGDQKLYVALGESAAVTIYLEGLPAYNWTSPDDQVERQAISLKTIVDAAMQPGFMPEKYGYDLQATDYYDLLADTLEGDHRQLPGYAELSRGFVIEYFNGYTDSSDLLVLWDEALDYSNSYKVRLFDRGIVRTVEPVYFDGDGAVEVASASSSNAARIELHGMPAVKIDGRQAVRLHHAVRDANLDGFDPKQRQYVINLCYGLPTGQVNLLADKLGARIFDLPQWDRKAQFNLHQGYLYNDENGKLGLGWDGREPDDGLFVIEQADGLRLEVYDVTRPQL